MPFSTLTFFKFSTTGEKWWAFKQMQISKGELARVEGQTFGKLLGSGAGDGFSIRPDFGSYVLLQSWQDEASAQRFFNSHDYYAQLNETSESFSRLHLKAFKSQGSWQGQNPFENQNGDSHPATLAVLTRARIKPKLLHRFWAEVPRVSRNIYRQEGRLFSKGIGEWPLIEQSTFSLWNSQQLMQNFAYQQEEHKRVVAKTRKLNWYSEELFARFELIESEGQALF